VGILKALFKLAILLVLGASVAGVVMVLKRPAAAGPVSYDEWPSVPHNPAAQ
jgi:hypothetical protein